MSIRLEWMSYLSQKSFKFEKGYEPVPSKLARLVLSNVRENPYENQEWISKEYELTISK